MTGNSIHPDSTLAYVQLTVSDLARASEFYRRALGFKVRRCEDGTAFLGAGGDDLLVLTERPGARQTRGTTGLYHFAIRVPSRVDLARVIQRVVETQTPVQGFADHSVSEAMYLADPDGNGIEIYRDRPRDEWRDDQGRLRMTTEPIDLDGVMSGLKEANESRDALPIGTVLGHVHLKVSHVRESEAFYCGVLGFDLTARYGPAAAFVSAGGYHHHIGMNTWESAGSPPAPEDAVGLRFFVVHVPNAAELQSVADRVRRAGLALRETDAGWLIRDPSQNSIAFAAR